MSDFASRLTEILSQPLVPWLILAVIVTGVLLGQVGKLTPDDPIKRMKTLFGVGNIPHGLALLIAALWFALVIVLVAGLFTLLYEIVWGMTLEEAQKEESDFRFLLAKTTALTAVLGALVALPFTALRLKLTTEQTRHNEDVLYNDKLHNALDDLHSRRQLSDGKWEDDIIRRNGAIDRLEALVIERPEMAPRISRMLCVYAKEVSREHPAESAPQGSTPIELRKWARSLSVKRSDVANAIRVIGEMRSIKGVKAIDLFNDLGSVNLQGMELVTLNFSGDLLNDSALDGADFTNATMESTILSRSTMNGTCLEGAKLHRASLNRAQLYGADCLGVDFTSTELLGTILDGATLDEARLLYTQFDQETSLSAISAKDALMRSIDLRDTSLNNSNLAVAFGDGTVLLPPRVREKEVKHWPTSELSDEDFEREYTLFTQDPAGYVPPQHRSPSE